MSHPEHRIEISSQERDGVRLSVHRYVEKRLYTRSIPNPDGTGMQFVAQPTEIYQLSAELKGGSLVLEPGALQYMHGRISSEVIKHEKERGFFSRAVASSGTGESAYATKMSGQGSIWCEPGHRHFIIATMEGPGDALLLDDKAFYACSGGISLTSHTHRNVAGVFSGNGFMQPLLSGSGVFAVETPVPVEEIEVIELTGDNDEAVIDGDYMLMYSANLSVSIGPLVSGLRNMLRSGEGFVYKLRGRGVIYVMPTAKVT